MWTDRFLEHCLVFVYSIETVYNFNQLLFLFFFYGFLGWILEFVYRSVTNIRLVNPGFLKGPFVPLYGFAGLFLHITLIFTWDKPLIARLLIYFSVITAVEFLTGEILLRTFKRRWWDYSDNHLNLRGHICLKFSCIWTLLALLFEETLYIIAFSLLTVMQDNQLLILNSLALFVFQIDFIYSSGLPLILLSKYRLPHRRVAIQLLKPKAVVTQLKQQSKKLNDSYVIRKRFH